MNLFNTARFILMSLVVFFILNGCTHRVTYSEDIEIIWNGSKAEKLTIVKELAGNPGKAQVEKQVLIYLSSNPSTPILGQYELTSDKVVFTPLIPFTHGKTYRVTVNGKLIDEIKIPTGIVVAERRVVEVYPTR